MLEKQRCLSHKSLPNISRKGEAPNGRFHSIHLPLTVTGGVLDPIQQVVSPSQGSTTFTHSSADS